MQIDLHGCQRGDAFIEICKALDECKIMMDDQLDIIHGYHQGQSLRSFVRSGRLIKMLRSNGYQVKKINISDPGKTSFSLTN
ncbi:MAG: hypothetical protein GF364_06000 [Candidatus Lokiarchaeota archaeon]|nr:hypothetical protein [Candidatus Lokiarchaeota archaeon]